MMNKAMFLTTTLVTIAMSYSSSAFAQSTTPANRGQAAATGRAQPAAAGAVATADSSEERCRPKCKAGYECSSESYVNPLAPTSPPLERFSCKPKSIMTKYPELFEACGGDISKAQSEDPKDSACKAAWADSDMNTCGKKAKEADQAYSKFAQACADTQIGDVKKCMEEARSCYKASATEESKSSKTPFDSSFLSSLGLGSVTSLFSNNSERVTTCSPYGLKDYETEKRERSRALRDAQQSMAKTQKELAQDKKELAEKKKDIQEDFVKMQTQSREQMTEQQKALAEEGMNAQKQMMEIDQQKAELRAANITARSQSAKVTGERALALAELSDAMIDTKCMVELEAALAAMKNGMSAGAQNYLNRQQERKRRIQGIKELCYAKFQAIRTATYKDYRAQIDAVDNNVSENNRRIEALDQQKVSIGKNQQEAITRAQTAQQQANNELKQKMEAAQLQMAETLAAAQQDEIAAAKNIKLAETEISEVTADIRSLGKRPKGLKQPTEAASQFRQFASLVRAMESGKACEPEVKRLTEKMAADGVKPFYDKDISTDLDGDDDDEDESTTGRD